MIRAGLRERGVTTAGRMQASLSRLQDVNAGHLRQLSDAEQIALARRFARSADPDGTRRFVNALEDTEDVRHLLDEDRVTTNRLVDWHRNPGHHRNIDPNLEAHHLLYVGRHGDATNTRLIALHPEQDGSNTVIWLEQGTDDFGRTHLIGRHATGRIPHSTKPTYMYPVGGTVRRQGGVTYRLPDNMDMDEIDDLIYTGIRQGSRDPSDSARIVFNPSEHGFGHTGITEMRIVQLRRTEGITTAYPRQGPSVVTIPPGE